MIRLLSFVGAPALAVAALSGCAVQDSRSFNPKVTTDIQTALTIACPMLSAIQQSRLTLTPTQTAAVKATAAACPPNPPPTSELTATQDLVKAYLTLKPVLK